MPREVESAVRVTQIAESTGGTYVYFAFPLLVVPSGVPATQAVRFVHVGVGVSVGVGVAVGVGVGVVVGAGVAVGVGVGVAVGAAFCTVIAAAPSVDVLFDVSVARALTE